MEDTTKIICTAISSIVTALILGEVFGNAISKPIAVWRTAGIDKKKIATLFDTMNQRICDLEDYKKKMEETV